MCVCVCVLIFIYLAASSLSCGTMRSFVVVCWLPSSCGMQALEGLGSVVVVCGLSCPVACEILVPQCGVETVATALESGMLILGNQ